VLCRFCVVEALRDEKKRKQFSGEKRDNDEGKNKKTNTRDLVFFFQALIYIANVAKTRTHTHTTTRDAA
jgi:hypothetical protein